jgi:hypothetical protein
MLVGNKNKGYSDGERERETERDREGVDRGGREMR